MGRVDVMLTGIVLTFSVSLSKPEFVVFQAQIHVWGVEPVPPPGGHMMTFLILNADTIGATVLAAIRTAPKQPASCSAVTVTELRA